MAPMKKAMKAMKAMKGGKSITKGGLADAISGETELKKSDCSKVLTALAEVVAKEVKKTGKVIIPGIARIVTRTKPATKAGKREMFGKVVVVKARPARTVVKAFPVAAIKQAV
uniref:Major basic nuclear protein n=1 Tax=Pfiesteria piscicida TaxID=71001 RepID=Q6YNE1_PFIPI|nr:major basic nuclear protein [Pfiesteria piscicida]ABI14214.1 major basic nuclear protein [Pfiesteria piscicida]ABI14215.1 major basic nuclear protein [Pfiesteria piscicida]ABI14219.1 major basic nuclear protein [Pfiesteria piscicida]